jgi:hypothetical protein
MPPGFEPWLVYPSTGELTTTLQERDNSKSCMFHNFFFYGSEIVLWSNILLYFPKETLPKAIRTWHFDSNKYDGVMDCRRKTMKRVNRLYKEEATTALFKCCCLKYLEKNKIICTG